MEDDFKHLVRISRKDVDGNKTIAQKFNIPDWMLNRREDYETGKNIHLIESDLDMTLRDDLNRMKKTRSYKGRRHEAGLPVRGQRTKSTFRNSSSVGVKRS